MTTAQNNVATERADRLLAPIGAAVAINQGDRIKVSSKLAVVTNGAQDACIGVADESNPVASIGGDMNPNIAGAAGAVAFIPNAPYKGCAVIYMIVNNGETLGFWDAAYMATDPQKVSSSSSSATQIGRCVELTDFLGDGSKRAKILMCGAN